MFSLPSPIPPPPGDASLGTHFSSDTATLPFPTHQVITTLSSSRKHGDWGLKRPLPLKSTTKSTHPMLRIKAIDTIEQITDYTSATDHGITLRKFQELNMPITLRKSTDSTAAGIAAHSRQTSWVTLPQKSVFEDQVDFTDIPPAKRAEALDRRWKFSGPWLAGMTQGEFNKWLAKEVRPKRHAFRAFLKKQLAKEKHEAAVQSAVDKGEEPPAASDPSSITDDELTDYLRRLRYNKQQLYDMVGRFLDLAPLQPPTLAQGDFFSLQPGSQVQFRETSNPYAEHGPPVTHPSAGISYLRTSMYMENHPIYGPQKHHAPVLARVVRPRRQPQSLTAKLGVGGFIVDPPQGDSPANAKNANKALYDRLDPSIEGGAKVWVQAQRASVDSKGRVNMHVSEASPESILVAKELIGEAECLGAQRTDQAALDRRMTADDIRQRYRAPDSPAMSSAADYGLVGSE